MFEILINFKIQLLENQELGFIIKRLQLIRARIIWPVQWFKGVKKNMNID